MVPQKSEQQWVSTVDVLAKHDEKGPSAFVEIDRRAREIVDAIMREATVVDANVVGRRKLGKGPLKS